MYLSNNKLPNIVVLHTMVASHNFLWLTGCLSMKALRWRPLGLPRCWRCSISRLARLFCSVVGTAEEVGVCFVGYLQCNNEFIFVYLITRRNYRNSSWQNMYLVQVSLHYALLYRCKSGIIQTSPFDYYLLHFCFHLHLLSWVYIMSFLGY